MGYWAEIKNNYFEGDFNASLDGDIIASLSIDAWKTNDSNEPGEVIARVLLGKHGDILVDYHDGIARSDQEAQKAISEAKDVLKDYYAKERNYSLLEPSEKVSVLCEEYEGDDGIREFTVIAVSKDKEALRRLMRSQIENDGYGLIERNGVIEDSDNCFCTEFNEGFVEYYILDEFVLPNLEINKMIAETRGEAHRLEPNDNGTLEMMSDTVDSKEPMINLWGRLGISLDVTPEELEVLKGSNYRKAEELFVNLVRSERCRMYGDTYFPEQANEEHLLGMDEELSFDLANSSLHGYCDNSLEAKISAAAKSITPSDRGDQCSSTRER